MNQPLVEFWIVYFPPDDRGYVIQAKLYRRLGSLINALDSNFGYPSEPKTEHAVYWIDISEGTALQVEGPTWRKVK